MERIKIKKRTINSLVLVILIILFIFLIPDVFSQPENVQILSYSWYIDPYADSITIVGEVQNVGSNIIDKIYLGAFIYSKDGEARGLSNTFVYSEQILSQQKVPFRIHFFPVDSYTGDFSWLSIGIDFVEFWIRSANQTDNYQYPDLEIIEDRHDINSDGIYTVIGKIRNTGNQSAGRLLVVATFYNSSGHVIATGFSNHLNPDFLFPNQITSFEVTSFDATTQYSPPANQITDYELLIQTETPIIPEFNSFHIIIIIFFALGTILFMRRARIEWNRQ
jgi:hypothetical protein